MLFELEILWTSKPNIFLHLLINRLQSGEHPISSENGSVDFPLLSALTGNTEGWVGLVCQELLEAFQYSENDVRSSVHLEKTATILIAWSALQTQTK